ncbi:26697_t:CDS:2 [Racocetra persica]|uniref:26697_t:CDS:1 n=1 Tax=Racocetra persica TaxID=160502 RepID=A0ACA9Q555_9GLOM|nr:26697_t:CDS:2 [Racocetra persica]
MFCEETKTGEKELLTLPKIREITEYDTSFPAGEVLEAHKGVHVHVRTDKGIMDVWVSYKGVREKGNRYKDIKLEQLTSYEIENEGESVYFPEINEVIPARYFSEGLEANCCC